MLDSVSKRSSKNMWWMPGVAFVLVGALVFLVSSRQGASAGLASDTARKNKVVRHGTSEDVRRCLRALQEEVVKASKMHSTRQVSGSVSAWYYDFDQSSGSAVRKSLADVKMTANAGMTTFFNRPHKSYVLNDHELALIYENNVGVMVDVSPTCRVTNVYEPTPTREIHPLLKSALAKREAVEPDTECTATFAIQGVASGGYLRYDTDLAKVVQHFTAIDAAASVDNFEKWKLEYFLETLPNTATALVFKVKSARSQVVFPYLTMEDKSPYNPTAYLNYGTHDARLKNQLLWVFYKVTSSNPVGVTVPEVFLVNQPIVMYNTKTKKCLCINSKANTAGAVTACDCTNSNAVLKLTVTSAPTGLDDME